MGLRWRRSKQAQAKALVVIASWALWWPPLHLIAAKCWGFSTWRFFGWGMYANPDPESQTRLRLVILPATIAGEGKPPYQQLFSELSKLSTKPEDESWCVNLFVPGPSGALQRQEVANFCQSPEINRHLDYTLHFSSQKHLRSLVDAIKKQSEQHGASVLVYLTHQRLDLGRNIAYTESEAYFFDQQRPRYLGRINDEP